MAGPVSGGRGNAMAGSRHQQRQSTPSLADAPPQDITMPTVQNHLLRAVSLCLLSSDTVVALLLPGLPLKLDAIKVSAREKRNGVWRWLDCAALVAFDSIVAGNAAGTGNHSPVN